MHNTEGRAAAALRHVPLRPWNMAAATVVQHSAAGFLLACMAFWDIQV